MLLEDWLNDGAPLAGPTARDCLIGWYGDNLPGTNKWVVGGKRIVPSKIRKPALVMIPSGDRIVPPLSAAALVDPRRGLKNATRIDLPLGHIGMVVSGRARELCWTPLIDWLGTLGSGAQMMAARERSFDWRLPAIWAVLLTVSVFAHAYVEVADSGHRIGLGRAVAQEAASHIMVAALLPVIYWLHRRFPLGGSPRNILIHVLAVVPRRGPKRRRPRPASRGCAPDNRGGRPKQAGTNSTLANAACTPTGYGSSRTGVTIPASVTIISIGTSWACG